jgi:hypothetical protein
MHFKMTAQAILTYATIVACALGNAGRGADQSAEPARREHVGAARQ